MNGSIVRTADLDTADLLSEPFARAANVRKEPRVTDAAQWMYVRYHESTKNLQQLFGF